jgi:hypothetical protein
MEFELVIFRKSVQHGLKGIGCSAAFRICMSDQSISINFNEIYFDFSCT